MEKFSGLVQLGFPNNLTSFIAFQKTFRTPVIRAPVPGGRKTRAVEDMTNRQVVGLEGLATPYHRAHLELVFLYV